MAPIIMSPDAPSARRLRVLVVDDIEASCHALCALVAELGHDVGAARDGASALREVAERQPDVVLLDLLMPDIDGFEVTRRVRALCAHRWLPVIVTSSLQGDEHFIHALENGADDYLTRPVNARLLDAKLRHYARVLDLQSRLEALALRQRHIHDNIVDAVITLDGAGTVSEANLAACRIFGTGEPSSIVGRSSADVLGADLDTLRGGREMSLRRADGSRFPAEVGLGEWKENDGPHCTLVVRDLTERRRIERMKDEFLATVSHELRTPLTSVLGALGLLAAGAAGPLPAAALPLAAAAQRNGERLSRLIDDILDLTKLEADRLAMRLQPVPLGRLLREAHAAHQGYAQRAGVILRTEVGDEAGALELRVDPDRFLQVLANLLSNAIRHSPPGEVVSVSVSTTPASVRIRVRDRGPGIAPEFRARMFEKFSQADGSDHRVQGGTGLGLYVSRMLVERMGGRIEFEPTAGAGATFCVEFPLQASPRAATWVLIVDSDPDARQRVAQWVEPLCAVDGAASLAQADERARRDGPPVIIADTRAQGSADEFCAGLRRLASGRPVLLYSDSVDDSFARRMGLAWLRKSGTGQDELVRAVREALGRAVRAETA